MNEKNKVAINIITTHNEPHLEKCLQSVLELNPEYVIGYTGDISKEEYQICLKYAPNSTYIFEWNDNFSDARNFIREKTNSSWIIWIDSDELIEKDSINKINKLLESKPKGLYHKFRLIHGSTTMGQIRMFYNTDKIKWSYPVHERILFDNLPQDHYDIEIVHKVQNILRSSDRNIRILKKSIDQDETNPEFHFYIAIEYHLCGKQMKALLHAEKFLYFNGVKGIDIRKMYMRYLISWINIYHIGNNQKAIQILLAQLIMNCNISEFWCLLGDAYVRLGKFDSAKQFYSNAITMGEFKYDNMWLVDLDKYDKYPKERIKYCEKFNGVDLVEFQKENYQPIIP